MRATFLLESRPTDRPIAGSGSFYICPRLVSLVILTYVGQSVRAAQPVALIGRFSFPPSSARHVPYNSAAHVSISKHSFCVREARLNSNSILYMVQNWNRESLDRLKKFE